MRHYLQVLLNRLRHRVRASEHLPRGSSQILERRHSLAMIVERGTGVLVVKGVLRAGSFKSYLRMAHKEVLLLRGLAMKGYIAPRRRTRGTAEWKAASRRATR